MEITSFAPPPESISPFTAQRLRRDELSNLDRMARELDLERAEADTSPGLHQLLDPVTAEVPQTTIVKPIERPVDGRDPVQRVRDGYPDPAPGAQDSCCLPQGGQIVGNVLDDCDREHRAERARREWQTFGRAANPERPFRNAFRLGEAARLSEPFEGEIAADGELPRPCGLDDRVARATHANVHQRCRSAVDRFCRAQAVEVADSPVLRLVPLVAGKLRVEEAELMVVLCVGGEQLVVHHDDDAIRDREAPVLIRADGFVTLDDDAPAADWAPEQLFEAALLRPFLGASGHPETLAARPGYGSPMRTHRDFLATHDTAIPGPDARLRLFIREYERYRAEAGATLRVLDVGCGKSAVLSHYVDPRDEYWGCDFYDGRELGLDNYVQVDLNADSLVDKLEGAFDVIFCGEVLEHLFSPDSLVGDLRGLLAADGILILSTPNLGYYVNRLLLLVGISPLYLESSAEAKIGRRTRLLGQGNQTEGHIRLFTYRALRDFLTLHELEPVRILPTLTWNFLPDLLVCKLSRSLAPNNVFVVKKKDRAGPPRRR